MDHNGLWIESHRGTKVRWQVVHLYGVRDRVKSEMLRNALLSTVDSSFVWMMNCVINDIEAVMPEVQYDVFTFCEGEYTFAIIIY